MPEITSHRPSSFNWVELATTDLATAKKFYGSLFGWTTNEVPAGEAGTYTMVQLKGKDVGGSYSIDPVRMPGVPPHWMPYINVENVDAVANKMGAMGGKVIMPAMDVMDVGRMAVGQDPTGAHFSVWQKKKHFGAAIGNESGTPCWYELNTNNVGQAGEYYSSLFGWTQHQTPMGPMTYTMFHIDKETAVGGMCSITPEMGPVPPHWLVYFQVDDCEATMAKCTAGGGKTLMGPQDVPNVGRMAVLQDPAGAVFAVIKLQMA